MIFRQKVDSEKYILVEYFLESRTTLFDAAWNLAIGQSVGNPNVRNEWETDELFEKHSCLVVGEESDLKNKKSGLVTVAFPAINIDFSTDGVSHLLVNIMGGQLDIDIIEKCHVKNIEFPEAVKTYFAGPRFGISGIREFTGVDNKPVLGSIIKPKTGIAPHVLLDMVKQLVDGGVNFIKEDEILSSPAFCRIEDRLPPIMDYLEGKGVIYSVSIHSDFPYLADRVKLVHKLGGNSVHVNFWCGFGAYKTIREMDLPLFIHFQKSGDKILTNRKHDFYIDWTVICKLAAMCGVDTVHAGMIGGYYKWEEEETLDAVNILTKHNVLPALSCGFHPGLTDYVTSIVGPNYMANVGGAIHGHPGGTTAGAKAMRQSIDKTGGKEFSEAIDKWGKNEVAG